MKSKQYIDNQIKWLKEIVDSKFEANQKAVDNYSDTNNEWKNTHNNLQREMKEQEGTFVTRKELWLAVLAIITVVISVLTLILKK